MYKWSNQKAKCEAELDRAGITDKEFRKLYLNFNRRINTLWNMRERSGWNSEAMYYSQPMTDAEEILEKFNNGGSYGCEDAEYWDTWKTLCEANNMYPKANVGDFLA